MTSVNRSRPPETARGPGRPPSRARTLRVAAVLALVGSLLALVGGPAYAADPDPDPPCLCQPGAPAQNARAAEVIFSGTVTAVAKASAAQRGQGVGDTYESTVDTVYKGEVSTAETTFRTDRIFAQCGKGFRAGQTVMVFAERGDPLTVRGCGGTAVATTSLVDKIESIFGPGQAPVPPEPFEVTFTAPADQPGPPPSITRAAAPGLALALVALAGLVVVRRLGRRRG